MNHLSLGLTKPITSFGGKEVSSFHNRGREKWIHLLFFMEKEPPVAIFVNDGFYLQRCVVLEVKEIERSKRDITSRQVCKNWSKVQITEICIYRSRQYYKSKALHNTEVTWFFTIHRFLHTWEQVSTPQQSTLAIEESIFWPFSYDITKIPNSKVDCEVNIRPILTRNVS